MKRAALLLTLLLLVTLCACTAGSDDATQDAQEIQTARDAARLTEDYLAAGHETDDLDALTARVENDLSLLEPTAFRHWVALERAEGETLTYRMDFDGLGITDTLRVEKQDSGDVAISITQGELQDLWTYQGNGTVLCNGERVTDCETLASSLVATEPSDGGTTVQAAPVSCFNQDPQSAQEVLADPDGYTLGELRYVYQLPMPGQVNRLTAASVIQVLSASATEQVSALSQAPATDVFPALCAAAGQVGEEARPVVLDNGNSQTLSTQIHPFTAEDGTTVYAVRTYAKEGLHGAQFLWGVVDNDPT